MNKVYRILKRSNFVGGRERSRGQVWHAVGQGDVGSICGTYSRTGWTKEEGNSVTCIRCLLKLRHQEGKGDEQADR